MREINYKNYWTDIKRDTMYMTSRGCLNPIMVNARAFANKNEVENKTILGNTNNWWGRIRRRY